MKHYFIPLKSYFSFAIQPAVWALAMGPCGWLTSFDSCAHHITSSVLVLCPDRGIRNINDVTQLAFVQSHLLHLICLHWGAQQLNLSSRHLSLHLCFYISILHRQHSFHHGEPKVQFADFTFSSDDWWCVLTKVMYSYQINLFPVQVQYFQVCGVKEVLISVR